MKFILKLLVSALAVWLTCWFLDNVTCSPWYYSLVVAIVLGIINMIIKPIVKLFNLLTLGLFSLVINGLMVMLCAHFVDGFTIAGTSLSALGTAIIFSVVLSIINWLLHKLVD